MTSDPQSPEPNSDRQLVKRYQQGDRAAFEQLVCRYQDRLFRLALLALRREVNAQDAVQEVFLRAFKGLSRFRFAAEPFTWLYRTLQNVCQELNRQQPPVQENEHSNAAADETKDDKRSIDWQIDKHRQIQHVKMLVDALPNQQREVVILRVFEELSVAQTAKILGCRKGTVKAHLFKAVANLRKAIPRAQDTNQAAPFQKSLCVKQEAAHEQD